MSDDIHEQLIDLVREATFLYDLRHCDYKDTAKKAQAWKEIAEKLNQNIDSVKLKWKNLRDSYVKYLKYLKGATGSAKKYKNWPWAAHLEFLKESVTPRPTVSNVPESSESEIVVDDEDTSGGSSVIIDDVADDGSSMSNDDSLMPPPKNRSQRKLWETLTRF
ncbi:hypothetical protein GE061_012893 [Apolygus lucorum]|uniref:MADF domain-containing protein n=1 Tax=Apolygus lucorum TaxID=248454 RepID=A0A8S9XVN4_APOLU|nr:hypothetical protein GE061_012893 [Apolygus lucorum]